MAPRAAAEEKMHVLHGGAAQYNRVRHMHRTARGWRTIPYRPSSDTLVQCSDCRSILDHVPPLKGCDPVSALIIMIIVLRQLIDNNNNNNNNNDTCVVPDPVRTPVARTAKQR